MMQNVHLKGDDGLAMEADVHTPRDPRSRPSCSTVNHDQSQGMHHHATGHSRNAASVPDSTLYSSPPTEALTAVYCIRCAICVSIYRCIRVRTTYMWTITVLTLVFLDTNTSRSLLRSQLFMPRTLHTPSVRLYHAHIQNATCLRSHAAARTGLLPKIIRLSTYTTKYK